MTSLIIMLCREESQFPESGAQSQARPAWGQGIEAQRLQKVNRWSRELEVYLLQIQSLIGCPKLRVPELKMMIPLVEQARNRRIGRCEKKVKWALLACAKEAFPLPEQFVGAAVSARLPFVQHLPLVDTQHPAWEPPAWSIEWPDDPWRDDSNLNDI